MDGVGFAANVEGGSEFTVAAGNAAATAAAGVAAVDAAAAAGVGTMKTCFGHGCVSKQFRAKPQEGFTHGTTHPFCGAGLSFCNEPW